MNRADSVRSVAGGAARLWRSARFASRLPLHQQVKRQANISSAAGKLDTALAKRAGPFTSLAGRRQGVAPDPERNR
jgi:hypothetical protein